MKRILLFTVTLMFISNTITAQESVKINRIEWATCNVGESGTFVENPEDFGILYPFEEAQKVCPDGWRTPTTDEFISLIRSGSNYVFINDIGGIKFGSGKNTIFLPAAGYNHNNSNGIRSLGRAGHYWSSEMVNSSLGFSLYFDGETVKPNDFSRSQPDDLSVRYVRK